MSRPEKATSSCYLENKDFWVLIKNIKIVYNRKSTKKNKSSTRMYESSRKKLHQLAISETIDFETWQWGQELFRIKNQLKKKLFFIIWCMGRPEKATSSCDLRNYRFLRLDYEPKCCLESKINWKKKIFIIGCMIRSEKATSSCDLRNYRLLRLDYEDKNCLESKTNKKNNLHQRMYESSRKTKSPSYLENFDFWDLIMKIKVAE